MAGSGRGAVRLHTFPSEDPDFRAFAQAELAALAELAPAALQAGIRRRYPLATVSVRSDLARLAGNAEVWYVFRHAPAPPPDDAWWERLDTWAILDRDRTFVDATEAFAEIIEAPVGAILGRRIEDLANPSDPTVADDIAALWAGLEQSGSVHGTLRFDRLDGTPREIEYHAEAEPSGARYRAVIRER